MPQNIVATSVRPDMVIVSGGNVKLVELMVPYNSPEALRNARQRKESKENYQLLLSELDRLGYRASLTTLEVGALGHSLPRTHAELRRLLPCVEKRKIRQLFDKAGRISITCFHAIFRGNQNSTGMKKNHFKLSPPTATAAQILLKSVSLFS